MGIGLNSTASTMKEENSNLTSVMHAYVIASKQFNCKYRMTMPSEKHVEKIRV